MHGTYFATYLNFAMVIAAYYLVKDWNTGGTGEKIIYASISLISILSIYFLNSRTGYLIFFISFLLLALMMIRGSILPKKLLLPGLAVLLIFSSVVWFTPNINKRIKAIGQEFSHLNSMPAEITEFGAIRIPIWKIALSKISEKPLLGYGNGDVTDTLVAEYERYGYSNIVKHRYNAHNQYLQTHMAAGIFALILLCVILFLPFLQALSSRDIIYACFLTIIICLFIIDTGLKVQAGVIFYALFNAGRGIR